jgi:hypothetical protein
MKNMLHSTSDTWYNRLNNFFFFLLRDSPVQFRAGFGGAPFDFSTNRKIGKMNKLVVLVCIGFIAAALSTKVVNAPERISSINSRAATWKAGYFVYRFFLSDQEEANLWKEEVLKMSKNCWDSNQILK